MTFFITQLIALMTALLVAQSDRRKKRVRRRRRVVYSTSEKNAIIDATIHPLADEDWVFVVVDGLLHAANESESDPLQSFLKFMKYNAPELLKRILKDLGGKPSS